MENIPFQPDQNRFVRRRIEQAARRVDRFVAMSERARLHLSLWGVEEERISVLPVGTDPERFGPAPDARDGRALPGRSPCRASSTARASRTSRSRPGCSRGGA